MVKLSVISQREVGDTLQDLSLASGSQFIHSCVCPAGRAG